MCWPCFSAKVLATASAVSRANMATSDWLRRFDYDRVFWSHPQSRKDATDEGGSTVEEEGADIPATQGSVYEGLGERIVDDAINVSANRLFRRFGVANTHTHTPYTECSTLCTLTSCQGVSYRGTPRSGSRLSTFTCEVRTPSHMGVTSEDMAKRYECAHPR